MRHVSDAAIARLRDAAEWPDLSHTKYDIVEPIARGGMSLVFRGRDRELDRDVAIKVMSVACAAGRGASEVAERARQEARILAALEHPGIVPVHDMGELPDGRVYSVMKYVRGEGLDLAAAQLESLAARLRIFQRLCETVAFAHTHGVIHRDLKPANVMIGAFGEVLVMDWGIARLRGTPSAEHRATGSHEARPADATLDGSVLGTPGYMAPEQERGELDRIDERTDVFALGAILDFLIHGVAPDAHATPPAVRSIKAKAMAVLPDDRYPRVEALADDIARFMDGNAVSAHRESLRERAGRVIWQYRTPLALIATYLVLRIALLLWP